MDKIGDQVPEIQSQEDLRKLTRSSTDASQTRRARQATALAEKLLSSYPDYGKASKTYLLSIAEVFNQLPQDVAAAALNITTGVRARCAFLPTVADIVKFAEDYRVKQTQFQSPPRYGIYQLLEPSNEPAPTSDECQRCRDHWNQVKEQIYAEQRRKSGQPDSVIVPDNLSNEEAAAWVGERLRTPSAPPSDELVELVRQQREQRKAHDDAEIATGKMS